MTAEKLNSIAREDLLISPKLSSAPRSHNRHTQHEPTVAFAYKATALTLTPAPLTRTTVASIVISARTSFLSSPRPHRLSSSHPFIAHLPLVRNSPIETRYRMGKLPEHFRRVPRGAAQNKLSCISGEREREGESEGGERAGALCTALIQETAILMHDRELHTRRAR